MRYNTLNLKVLEEDVFFQQNMAQNLLSKDKACNSIYQLAWVPCGLGRGRMGNK
jgi:hypothetical protein